MSPRKGMQESQSVEIKHLLPGILFGPVAIPVDEIFQVAATTPAIEDSVDLKFGVAEDGSRTYGVSREM